MVEKKLGFVQDIANSQFSLYKFYVIWCNGVWSHLIFSKHQSAVLRPFFSVPGVRSESLSHALPCETRAAEGQCHSAALKILHHRVSQCWNPAHSPRGWCFLANHSGKHQSIERIIPEYQDRKLRTEFKPPTNQHHGEVWFASPWSPVDAEPTISGPRWCNPLGLFTVEFKSCSSHRCTWAPQPSKIELQTSPAILRTLRMWKIWWSSQLRWCCPNRNHFSSAQRHGKCWLLRGW